MIMKNKVTIVLALACLAVATGCSNEQIQAFDIGDSAVYFQSRSNTYSLIGISDDEIELSIPVKMVGPKADYDREISLNVKDSTAVRGKDYEIVSSMVAAGELNGKVVIRVKALPEDVEELYMKLEIVRNGHFPNTFYSNNATTVGWTASYSRPMFEVWRYWYLYFAPCYSKAMHKVIVETLGVDVDKYTCSRIYVEQNPELTFKLPTWWYSANRKLREEVAAYDKAHPDNPLRHSADFERYNSYNVAVGEGTKEETLPTILSTLNVY